TDLWQQCEDAGGGIVYEPRATSGLAYRTQAATGQSVTLALPAFAGYGVGSLTPRLNNTYTANDVTVTRQTGAEAGSTVRAVLGDGSPMSINPSGRPRNSWPAKATVNLQHDNQLAANAAWRLARGTVADVRWPQVPLRLTLPAFSPYVAAARQLDIGDR